MIKKIKNNNEPLPTIFAALQYAKGELRKYNRCENAGELILLDILAISRSEMLVNLKQTLLADQWSYFCRLLRRHAVLGEPVQYLLKKELFYGNCFFVNKDVLIPRPETEELIDNVHLAITTYFSAEEQKELFIADIGTGSGVIAITMQLKYKQATVCAVDISERALAVAKVNAGNLKVNNINFWHGSLGEPLRKKRMTINVLIANLPYIPTGEKDFLRDTVRDYEPEGALYGGSDGLDLYKTLIEQLPTILADRAVIGFEIGYNQAKTVLMILQQYFPSGKGRCLVDISGKERMVLFQL